MKDALQMLALAAVILVVGFLAYDQIFETKTPGSLEIRSVEGRVMHRSSEGEQPAVVGSRLAASDRVVTSEGGRVSLTLGDSTELELDSESSLAVIGSNRDGLKVELEGGLVQAVVRPGGTALTVLSGEREVLARDAEFSVALGDDGTSAVESKRGVVELEGFDGVGTLEAGQRVSAVPGVPVTVGPIPDALLLDVKWPDASTREKESQILGKTEPGAVIWIEHNGRKIRTVADENGEFALDGIPLKQGENALVLHGESILGASEQRAGKVVRDSEAPTGAFEVNY